MRWKRRESSRRQEMPRLFQRAAVAPTIKQTPQAASRLDLVSDGDSSPRGSSRLCGGITDWGKAGASSPFSLPAGFRFSGTQL